MKWIICGVLLVVVVVNARMGVRERRGSEKGVESPLLTTNAKVGGQVEKRQLAKASWYCYDMVTLAEESIAMSEMAIFADGANKEGKTIEVGKLRLLTIDHSSKGLYCAVAPANTSGQPLTPKNNKIKFMTIDSMKFYSTKVMVRDPFSVWDGFKRLKAALTQLGLAKKVQLGRPAVIYNLGDIGGEILFPEN